MPDVNFLNGVHSFVQEEGQCQSHNVSYNSRDAKALCQRQTKIGEPVDGRRAIASKTVSTGVKSMSYVSSSLILSSNSGSRTKECCLKKGEISISA